MVVTRIIRRSITFNFNSIPIQDASKQYQPHHYQRRGLPLPRRGRKKRQCRSTRRRSRRRGRPFRLLSILLVLIIIIHSRLTSPPPLRLLPPKPDQPLLTPLLQSSTYSPSSLPIPNLPPPPRLHIDLHPNRIPPDNTRRHLGPGDIHAERHHRRELRDAGGTTSHPTRNPAGANVRILRFRALSRLLPRLSCVFSFLPDTQSPLF